MDKTNIVATVGVIGVGVVLVIAMTIGIIWVTSVAVDADEFYCDWIFCSFKKTIKEADCYQNGEPINCTEMIDIHDEKNLEPSG